MAITETAQQLEEQIRALPCVLRTALEKEMRARRKAKELEQKIDDLEKEARLAAREEEGDTRSATIALARAALVEAEAEVEMRVRSGAQTKMTESHVQAAVRSDATVKRLRRALAEAESAGRDRSAYPAERAQTDSPQLVRLRAQLAAAEEEAEQAEIDVQVAEATIETAKMLVALATAHAH